MPGPAKAFGELDGLTGLVNGPSPLVRSITKIDAFTYLWRTTFTFFRFGIIQQSILISVGIKSSPRLLRPMQNVSVSRLMLVTFPPIYKTRTGRARPLKGQLWPRTR